MATEAELETLATWLEREGFALPKRRAITLSYVRLVFGNSTAEQLSKVCRLILDEARDHEQTQARKKPQDRKTYSVHWLRLRRLAE